MKSNWSGNDCTASRDTYTHTTSPRLSCDKIEKNREITEYIFFFRELPKQCIMYLYHWYIANTERVGVKWSRVE